ncbi:MAG: nucleotidyltransferase domain-containing protein [Defluviitaleaceae bacterium]|nr:nucleotidyltransferase domain-containing protein [Defluviitaleaceae bacterium]MCL2262159.1 nucleotidyltransferase domain-containing protein [Defluviitaleaceae bacterium]
MRKSHAKEFVDEYVREFEKKAFDVDSLVLFGSQARGTATISSDVDIAVVMEAILTPRERGELVCLGDEINSQVKINLFFTTKDAINNATHIFDTNKYIREEGVVLWQS